MRYGVLGPVESFPGAIFSLGYILRMFLIQWRFTSGFGRTQQQAVSSGMKTSPVHGKFYSYCGEK